MYCPKCGVNCEKLHPFKSLYHCKECKNTFREVKFGFTIKRWELIE